MIQFTTKYTVADMTALNRFASKIYPNKRVERFRIFYGFAGVALVAAGAATIYHGFSAVISYMCSALGGMYLLACVFHYRLMGLKTQNNRPKEVDSLSFTFDKLGMVVESSQGYGRFAPEEIANVAEGKTIFALFVKDSPQGFVVPKRALEDVDDFRAVIQAQYTCPYTTFTY